MRFIFTKMIAVILAASICPAWAQDQQPVQLGGPHSDEALVWMSRLAETTETVVVTRVTRPPEKRVNNLPQPEEKSRALDADALIALGAYISLSISQQNLLEFLRQFPPQLIVHGGENYKVASAFGTLVSEDVTIFRYHKPLEQEAQDQFQVILSGSEEVQNIAGHDVHEFPVTLEGREPYVKVQPWEGEFLCLLDDQMIIHGSSDRLLAAFLERKGLATDERRLREKFRLLAHMHTESAAWMVREVPPDPFGKSLFGAAAWEVNPVSGEGSQTPIAKGNYFLLPAVGHEVSELSSSRIVELASKSPTIQPEVIENRLLKLNFDSTILGDTGISNEARGNAIVGQMIFHYAQPGLK